MNCDAGCGTAVGCGVAVDGIAVAGVVRVDVATSVTGTVTAGRAVDVAVVAAPAGAAEQPASVITAKINKKGLAIFVISKW